MTIATLKGYLLEITEKVIVCVNLMDEAKRKHIEVDLTKYVFVGLVPFNGIKAFIVCIGTFILYKRLSIPIFKVDSGLTNKRNIA